MAGGYWKLMGQYDAETTTYSECAATPTSPYTPDKSGRLKGLRTVVNRSAAASLINHIQWKLTCTTFSPNSIECGAQGTGLQTAPALMGGVVASMDWAIDQAVMAGVPITIEARNVTADTPVTVSALIYGYFE